METTVFVLVVLALLLAGVVQVKIDRTDRKIARLDHKVDLILNHLDIDELGPAELGSVEALVRQGKKIEAIKLYRQITGAGLKEAKEAVEAIPGAR